MADLRAEVQSLLLRAGAGALIGAVVYAAYGFSGLIAKAGRAVFVPPDFPLWIVLMGLLVAPVTLLSAGMTRFAIHHVPWPARATILLVVPVTISVGVLLFVWYMSVVASPVAWWKAWLLPASAVAATAIIEMFVPRPERPAAQV